MFSSEFYDISKNTFFDKVTGLRLEACNFIKKETLAQVLSCEFCKISKNTFSHRTLVAATVKTLESQPAIACSKLIIETLEKM